MPKQPGIKPLYQCWQGEIKSETGRISIANPIDKEDQSIMKGVLSGEFAEGNSRSSEVFSSLPIEVRFSRSYPFFKEALSK